MTEIIDLRVKVEEYPQKLSETDTTKVEKIADSIIGWKFTSALRDLFTKYNANIESIITLLLFAVESELSDFLVYGDVRKGSLVLDWTSPKKDLIVICIAHGLSLEINVWRNLDTQILIGVSPAKTRLVPPC